MDRYRLKNIIILILVLVNLFLLGSLASRKRAEQSSHRRAIQEMVELFAAHDITLPPEVIPRETPPVGRLLTRDLEMERQAAVFLLGERLSSADQGGGIYTYASDNGAFLIRSTGSFDAVGTLASEDVGAFCRDFCREFFFDEPVFALDEAGNGTATAIRRCAGLPVYNCSVVFTLEEGRLVSAKGTLLPETYTSSGGDTLSALAALTAFQNAKQASGAVASAVTDMELCYELQSTTSASMSLVPVWRVATDTVSYYVNCVTGAVTQG